MKGISLHIGVNKLSLDAYENDGALHSPMNDARAMAFIAKAEGFETRKLLLNEKATKDNFIKALDRYADKLEPGDTFLLTFSGHGGQIEDDNGDEEDGQDETWCFYDGFLIDDQLGDKWENFKKGVRIIVVSASCHSRSALRVYMNNGAQKLPKIRNSKEIKQNGKSILSEYIADPKIVASILHISACEDDKEAHDGKSLSLFTSLLVQYWDEGRFTGNYKDLVGKIRKNSGYLQRAGLATLGKNDLELMHSQPFKLLTHKT